MSPNGCSASVMVYWQRYTRPPNHIPDVISINNDCRLFLHLLGRVQSFILGFRLSRQTGNGLDEFGNGCIGFGIVVSSSVNRKFGTSSGFGGDLTGQGLRRATKTKDCSGLPWGFSGQPALMPVRTRTRSHGCGFLRSRVVGFVKPMG